MTTFNELFNKTDQRYIDIPIDTDIGFYIDPTRIKTINSPYFNSVLAAEKVNTFFQYVFDLFIEGRKEDSFILIDEPKEINANHLGMSSGQSKGNGPSLEILESVFERLMELKEGNLSLLGEPILIPLFVPKFGKDRFSDLLTNIIIMELCEFTTGICSELDISVHPKKFNYFDPIRLEWVEGEFLLPVNLNGEHIVLTPKNLAVKEYSFTAQSYVWHTILPRRQEFHLLNDSLLVSNKEIKGLMVRKPPSKKLLMKEEVSIPYTKNKVKKYALEQTLNNPDLLEHYIRYVNEE